MRRIGSLVAIAAVLLGVGVAVAAAGQSSSDPVLGPQRYPASDQVGFGHVRPSTIFMGGDPTGLLCRIHWLTWGRRFAIGTGTSLDVTGHQTTAEGKWAPAVVVLSHLGSWQGRRAYLRYRWSFPDGELPRESAPCRV